MLIGLTGKKQAGKDTVADILVQEYGFLRVAFADLLKQMLEDQNPLVGPDIRLGDLLSWYDGDWDHVKQYPEVRRLLQYTGTAVRMIDPEFWINNLEIPDGNVVVSDVRLHTEARRIEDLGGQVFRVTRPGTGGDPHHTETELDGIDFPVLANDGSLQDLKELVERDVVKR